MSAIHLMFASLIIAIGGTSQTPAPVRPATCAVPAASPCKHIAPAQSPAPPRGSDRRIVYPLQ